MDKLCHCDSCVVFAAKADKFGNKSVQMTAIRQQVQMDLCRNKQQFQASVYSYQSTSNAQSRVQTSISMNIKSNFVVEVRPSSKPKSKFQPKIEFKSTAQFQTTIQMNAQSKAEPKRIAEVVKTSSCQSSPVRKFNSMPNNSKAVVPVQRIVKKTPIKTQSTLNQSAAKSDRKVAKQLIKKEETSDLKLKPIPATLVPKLEPDQSENKAESTGKRNIDSNMASNTVPEEVVAVTTVKKEIDSTSSICVKIEETSPTKSDPSSDEQLTQQQDAPDTPTEDEFAKTNDEDIKITPSQLKWTDEVLNLLNTGSEAELSKTLATIGPKTAIRITKCRNVHGKFDQIGDLQKRLGWSEKVFQKFLSKNFL